MNRPTATAAVISCTFAATMAVAGIAVMQASATTVNHSHALQFTTHKLHSTQLGRTETAEADRLHAGGKTIGLGMTLCTFDFAKGVARCNVTAALEGGMLYGKITVNGKQGTGTGTVTGGTGTYKNARGTVTTQPANGKSDTKVTITYHR